MKGFTLNKGAVNRWLLSHHQWAAIAKECQNVAGKGETERGRKDLAEAKIQMDESVIRKFVSTAESIINQFEYSGDDLINIFSGNVAPANVRADLEGAYDKGVNAVKDFEESRLKSEPEKLFEPIKSNKLKTFATVLKHLKQSSSLRLF